MPHPISALIRWLDHQGAVTFFAAVLLLLVTFGPGGELQADGQYVRFDPPLDASATTTQGAGLPFLVAIPNVSVAWCNYPANSTGSMAAGNLTPCTNYATTYTGPSGTACGNSAQIVLQGSSSCVATSDAFGNFGFYVSPGLYAYTITTSSGVTFGPFTASPSFSAGITVNGQTILSGGSGNVNVGAATHSVALNEGNGNPITGLLLGNDQIPVGQTGADPIAMSFSALGPTVNGQLIPLGGSGNVNVGASAHSLALNEGNGHAMTGVLLGLNQFAAGQTSADPIPSTIPTCLTGQHLFFGGTLPLTCTADTTTVGVQVQSNTVLASPVSITANTVTQWLSHSITMPASGCPCRVFGSYGGYVNFSSGNAQVQMWLSDGSSLNFATSAEYDNGSSKIAGNNGSGFTSATYSNGASVTFSAYVFSDGTGGDVVTSTATGGSSQASWMNLVVFTSN